MIDYYKPANEITNETKTPSKKFGSSMNITIKQVSEHT